MKALIGIVKSCEDCPCRNCDYEFGDSCNYMDIYEKGIEHDLDEMYSKKPFPSWCPLMDYKKAEE